MPNRLLNTFCLLFVSIAAGRASAAGIAGSYSGRYQCQAWNVGQEWNAVDLVIKDMGRGQISAVFTFPLRAGGGSASYLLAGGFDERNGSFQLMPRGWVGRAPAGNNPIVGMAGRFDPATRRLTGRMASSGCESFELIGAGGAPLSQLPPGSPTAPGQRGNPIFRSDPAPTVLVGAEYWDASMSDGKGALRESEPIDDVIDWLHKETYSCVGSKHVSWDATGTKGTATDHFDTRARFVIECDGNCRGLHYVPGTDASVNGFGRARPVPVMEMRSIWFGGSQVQWAFTRLPEGPPPEVYVHQWTATGFNNGPGCKAPKSNGK